MKPAPLPVLRALFSLGLLTLTSLGGTALAQGQQPGAPGNPAAAERQERPPLAEPQAQVPEELLYILTNWEMAGDATKKLEGKHRRYIYDYVFNVEKWAEGEFYYESPDKGRIDIMVPKNFKEDQTRERDGKVFTIQKDKAERWICDGTQVLAIDEERKEFQRVPIPVQNRGKNIADGPLPFLFGISKEKLMMRYNISLHDDPQQGGQHNLDQGRIHLRVQPLWQQDAANWQMAEIMLDAKSYLPHAVRLMHPGGNAETVYVFYDVKRNASRNVFAVWQGDPFVPRLSGYKEPAIDPAQRQDAQRR